jgi:biopolymer transport protein ExbD
MRHLIFVLAVLLISSCDRKPSLPESVFFERVVTKGKLRHVHITFKDGNLYHNDSVLQDLAHFRLNIFNYIEPNDGSNVVRVAFSSDRNTNINKLDSVFNLLRQVRFYGIVLMTNGVEDSVGIPTSLPPMEISEKYLNPSPNRSNVMEYSRYLDSVFIDSVYIPDSLLSRKLQQAIGIDSIWFLIDPSDLNTYNDYVSILDSYKKEYHKYKNDVAFEYFQKKYELLSWKEKDSIDYISAKARISYNYLYIVEETRDTIRF